MLCRQAISEGRTIGVHYEATHYPAMCTVFSVVLENGARHGLTTDWTVRECLEYAQKAGFTIETTRSDAGAIVFSWHRPTATCIRAGGR
jgi:hypothetical protein